MNIFLFGVITILCGHFCVSALCNVQPGLWQRVTSYHFKTLIRSVEEKNIFLKKDLFLIILTQAAQTHKLRKLSQWQENTSVIHLFMSDDGQVGLKL